MAGWVFRVEVVTENVAYPTKDMKTEMIELLKSSPNVKEVLVQELYEDIRLFPKQDSVKRIIVAEG